MLILKLHILTFPETFSFLGCRQNPEFTWSIAKISGTFLWSAASSGAELEYSEENLKIQSLKWATISFLCQQTQIYIMLEKNIITFFICRHNSTYMLHICRYIVT